MAHLQKYTRSALGQLCQHYERKKLPNGEYVKFGNEDIDLTKTHLNYNLASDRTLKNQIEFINERCSEVKCLNRKDVNVMCSWVITQPKEFPDNLSREFFEQTYKFLNSRYGGNKQGEQNVISAYVHLDEKSPHIHYAFVPVVHDIKTGKQKVSAKEAITKRDLLTFHKDLEKHLYEHFGFETGIINGATKEGNLSIKALKLKSEVESLTEKENKLKSRVQKYENLEVDTEVIDNIGKKNLLGNNISVPADKYSLLQEQAKAYCANRDTIDNIRERKKKLAEKERQLQEKEQLLQKKTIEKEQQSAKEVKRRNEYFNQRERSVEDSEKRNREYYNQVEQLFYEATSGTLTPQKSEELNTKITTLQNELTQLKADNEKLIFDLRNSVPGNEHQELLLSYKQLEQILQTEKKKNAKLADENSYLDSTVFVRDDTISKLKESNKFAFECLTNAIKAAGMLKYDDGDYKATLTLKQEHLIDGLAKYGEHWTKREGYPELAEEIKNHVSISKGIQAKIDELTPKKYQSIGGR